MKASHTRLRSFRSIAIREHQRAGRPGGLVSIRSQAGAGAVPFSVRQTSPLLWATQMVSELPSATAIAEIGTLPAIGALIADQVGGAPARALLQRQSERPPASNRSWSFGSSTKGATKFARGGLSVLPASPSGL